MTLRIEPMTAEHARRIQPQEQQAIESADERVSIAMQQANHGPCWAVLDPTGEVLAIAGVTEVWEGRGIAWSVLSRNAGPHLVALTRSVVRYLDSLSFQRLELYVDAQFAAGCRWARLLGFELETPEPMLRFLPNGSGAYLFARTK